MGICLNKTHSISRLTVLAVFLLCLTVLLLTVLMRASPMQQLGVGDIHAKHPMCVLRQPVCRLPSATTQIHDCCIVQLCGVTQQGHFRLHPSLW
jgi:hypothetical protein